jgi:hypothetical protein
MRLATRILNGVVVTDGIIESDKQVCDICKSHINYCSCKIVSDKRLAEVRAELADWRIDYDTDDSEIS